MNKKIFIDHCYNVDQGHKFLKKLEKLGFILDKNMMEHPGKAYCRFIIFKGENPRNRYYLEFVSIGRGGTPFTTPGLSLGIEFNLKGFYKKINKTIPGEFIHKNYEWKKNNEDYLPGWNFLDFKKPIIKNIHTWFTEYEPSGKRKKPQIVKHKNSVENLHGIILTLSLSSKKKLETLLNTKIKSNNIFKDGVHLYIQDGKTDRFESIILNSNNFSNSLKSIGRSGKIVSALGEEMIQISAPKSKVLNWNILIRKKD